MSCFYHLVRICSQSFTLQAAITRDWKHCGGWEVAHWGCLGCQKDICEIEKSGNQIITLNWVYDRTTSYEFHWWKLVFRVDGWTEENVPCRIHKQQTGTDFLLFRWVLTIDYRSWAYCEDCRLSVFAGGIRVYNWILYIDFMHEDNMCTILQSN